MFRQAALLIVLSCVCGCGDPADNLPRVPVDINRTNIYKHSPLELLAFLQARNHDRELTVPEAPKNWIKSSDVEALRALTKSTQPCAGVGSIWSSRGDDTPSTIGTEAAFLIRGYETGRYPPDLNSPRKRD
jgi:hypothetical protein